MDAGISYMAGPFLETGNMTTSVFSVLPVADYESMARQH